MQKDEVAQVVYLNLSTLSARSNTINELRRKSFLKEVIYQRVFISYGAYESKIHNI